MNKTTYLGVDPGKSGSICVITPDNSIKTFDLSHTETDIGSFLREVIETPYSDIFCLIEKVWSRPLQSASSGDVMMQNYGFMRGLLIAFKIPFSEVLPLKWQKEFTTSCKKADRLNKDATNEQKRVSRNINVKYKREHKNKLKGIAQQFYPDLKVTLKNSDSILIARFCKMTIL